MVYFRLVLFSGVGMARAGSICLAATLQMIPNCHEPMQSGLDAVAYRLALVMTPNCHEPMQSGLDAVAPTLIPSITANTASATVALEIGVCV